jgi:hypothetical protein
MRRTIANSLLLITLGLFFAPVLVAELPAPVAQCCLRTGKHHCAAMSVGRDSGNSFRATNDCPIRGGQAFSISAVVYASHCAELEFCSHALIISVVARQRAAAIRADHLRGPPAILS